MNEMLKIVSRVNNYKISLVKITNINKIISCF
jgi:hypothetical protein